MDIRNIAIIAHVDHGKTTLIDGMLKQTSTFRDNQVEMNQTGILDSNALEKERGITILAKNAAVDYKGVKINIIDTPGHADFGSEVERVLNMADGALLVVDAAEGPLPQTKFVLQKALKLKLKIILVINKVDKKEAKPKETLAKTEELFLKLASDESQLDFPVIYTVAKDGRAGRAPDQLADNLGPLFELILKEVPAAGKNWGGAFSMLVSALEDDAYLGKLAIGRIGSGRVKSGQRVAVVAAGGQIGFGTVEKLFTNRGIGRVEISEANCGDIVAVSGLEEVGIGQTIADASKPVVQQMIEVEEPTLKLTIGANTSPMAGKEGKMVTTRQIGERLRKEKETNLGMIFMDLGGGEFEVRGRGELHLAVLIENMRREGYEMQVSRPQVIMKAGDEPVEEVTIEVPDEYVGVVTTEMGKRRGQMQDMAADGKGSTRISYLISQRNMIGVRNSLLTQTKGTAVFHTLFSGYRPVGAGVENIRNGVLVALDSGKASAYSLQKAQERGITFVEPGEEVYEGMIVGLANKDQDVEINITKGKHLTNIRSAGADGKIALTPAYKMSLEQALDFIAEDELVEVTPKTIRLRKRLLDKTARLRESRKHRAAGDQ